jgi:hypothetical protein
MARSIEVDDEVFAVLEREAIPFEETTPNAVLRRLLKIEVSSPKGQPGSNGARARPARSSSRPSRIRAVTPPKRTRVPKGRLLPKTEYELPILQVLERHGGRAPSREVVAEVGELIADKLTQDDKEKLSSGDVRWENRVHFTRLQLVEDGLLVGDAPRGTWEISDKGRARLAGDE